MDEHNEAQRAHYRKQYQNMTAREVAVKGGSLYEWARSYPLLVFGGFLKTLKGARVVTTCSGAGRELRMMHDLGMTVTATDLTVDHLQSLVAEGVLSAADAQNAERLSYPDESFEYGFVNAGLHHLAHPHAGLVELMRVAGNAAIFIESQDSILHPVARMLGRRGADFEPAGNYVYRWSGREVEKIALSSHAHSFAIFTAFLPVLVSMRKVNGFWRDVAIRLISIANLVLRPFGNLMIVVIFKRPPTGEQIDSLRKASFSYVELSGRYPPNVLRNVEAKWRDQVSGM